MHKAKGNSTNCQFAFASSKPANRPPGIIRKTPHHGSPPRFRVRQAPFPFPVTPMSQPIVFIARAGGYGEEENRGLEHRVAVLTFREFSYAAQARKPVDICEISSTVSADQKSRVRMNHTNPLWSFTFNIRRGDIVMVPRKLPPHRHAKVHGEHRRARPVEWLRSDGTRPTLFRDLVHSFVSFLTACDITRKNAEKLVLAAVRGKRAPGFFPVPETVLRGPSLRNRVRGILPSASGKTVIW